MTSPTTKRNCPSANRYQGQRTSGFHNLTATTIAMGDETAMTLKTGPILMDGTSSHRTRAPIPAHRYSHHARRFMSGISARLRRTLGRGAVVSVCPWRRFARSGPLLRLGPHRGAGTGGFRGGALVPQRPQAFAQAVEVVLEPPLLALERLDLRRVGVPSVASTFEHE